MKVPIILIFFNRKDIVLKSFESIRRYRPTKLFLASDGPRHSKLGEKELVEDIRQTILKSIDWECEVKTLFRENNLGCRESVHSAINWFFDHVEAGIILEDDCVPQSTFYPFIEELLDLYKNDARIGMIDGANYITSVNIEDSYCFSKYKSTNGWATWKRAWKNMDIDMSWRNTHYFKSILMNMGYKSKDLKYWKYRLKVIDNNEVSAWDWQWYFVLSAANQLSIYPKISLISNIGFGEGATHTDNKSKDCYITDKELDFPLTHPKYIVPHYEFDSAFYHSSNTLFYILMRYIPFSMKKIIKKLIR